MHIVYPSPLESLSLSLKKLHLLQQYLKTNYEVSSPDFLLRVGQECTDFHDFYSDDIGHGFLFITAWNPASQPTSDEENASRQQRLLEEVSQYRVVNGVGKSQDGPWAEDSLGVFNVGLQDAKDIGDRYGQNAVVWIGPSAEPALVLCSSFWIDG